MVSGVLDEVTSSDDLDSEDYPSFMTMLRWLQWFRMNLENINGYLRLAAHRLAVSSVHSSNRWRTLDQIRESVPKWLETVMRIIYNSGGSLSALRW